MKEQDALYDTARLSLRAGDLAGADLALRCLLDTDPYHAPGLHLAGLLTGREGRDELCVALLERAIGAGLRAQKVISGLLLAAVHRRQGREAQAEQAWRDVLALAPDTGEALLNLGLLLGRQHRHDEALALLHGAVTVLPGVALVHAGLALSLHGVGDLDLAAASAAQAIALAPGNRDFTANLAVIRNAQGQFAQAEALCLAVLRDGDEAGLLNTLGIALKGLGRFDDAAARFRLALVLSPDCVDARYNLACLHKDRGHTGDAIALLHEVVGRAPDLAAARFALCMAHLPPLYDDEAEIERCRADYSRELAALEIYADEVGLGALAAGVGAAGPFCLPYQGGNDAELQGRHGALVCRAMAAAYPPVALADGPAPGERIRIGFVSGHVRSHSVWKIPTRGWIAGLDRSRFELFVYHTSGEIDAETARARVMCDHFTQGPCSTERWRARIAADGLHVLIYPEIGMDPMVARLAALRLAPVQYTSWGHPVTSGYPTIDAFLSSEAMEPEDAPSRYTERLVLLPGLSTSIGIEPQTAPTPAREALGIAGDAVVYWSAQSPYKYRPRHDGIFPAIARRVPQSCFVFTDFPDSPSLTQRFRDRLAGAFAVQGLDAGRHCVFLPRMGQGDFRAAMGVADVVLDNPGWSGCNSLVDGLAQGLPVVTWPGETMPSRHGAAMLRVMGLDAQIADSEQAYVDLAVVLGMEPERRRAIGRITIAGLPRLEDRASISALEAHILADCARLHGGGLVP